MHPKKAFIFIPRVFTPHRKVNITADEGEGTTTDVTTRVIKGDFTKRSFRVGIGDFKLKLINVGAALSGMWEGGDIVDFYADLVDATTPKFKGRIDSINELKTDKGNFLEIEGRHVAYPAVENWPFKSFSAQTNDVIVKGVADDFLAGFTYTNVGTFTNSLTKDWDGSKNVLDCFREVCVDGDADGYIDDDKDIHLFAENSILNSLDAAAEKQNLLSLVFGKDTYYEKTKITVYGKDDEGMGIIYTAGLGTRVLPPIIDFSIRTMEQAKEVADAALAQATDIPEQGVVLTRGLGHIEPGENMWVSSPSRQIHGIYKVIEIKHLIGKENRTKWSTQCKIERPRKGIGYQITQRARKEYAVAKIDNPNNMEFSYNFPFNDDSNIASGLEAPPSSPAILVGGRLYKQDGIGTKTIITNSQTLPSGDRISAFEIRVVGDNIDNVTYEISVVDGEEGTYETAVPNVKYDATHIGNQIKLKMTLADSDSGSGIMIYSLVILYKA